MADQSVEAPGTQDQPEVESAAVDAPVVEGGTSEQESSFEAPFNINDVDEAYRGDVERYVKQVQGAYTNKTQELAEQRKQYEQAQALTEWFEGIREHAGTDLATEEDLFNALGAKYGWLDNEDGDEELDGDESNYHDPRVDKMEEFFSEAAAQEALNQKVDQIASEVDVQAKKLGREFDESELNFILDRAMRHESPDDSVKATQAAVAQLREFEAKFQDRWIKSKSLPQVSTGVPGSTELDLNDTDTRRKLMEDLVNAQQ